MAERVALALIDGKISEVPSGDTLRGTSGSNNFSYHLVEVSATLNIPENQHMIATSLELDGFLDLDGGLVFL